MSRKKAQKAQRNNLMKFVHLLSRLTGTYWLITDEALENIASLLESRMIAGIALEPKVERVVPNALSVAGSTATIPIQGVIGKNLSPLEMACGGADVEAVQSAFDRANADPAISAIHLAIDSPGGTVTGVPELARHIYETKIKPVIAKSDSIIGSAAYYIAAAADEIEVTPTATVGSIGVVAQIRETIDPKSADGRSRLRVFRSGEDKMAGSDAPLTEKQAQHIQARAHYLGQMFRDFVSTARPAVKADSMTGLAYFGADAVARGLADRVVSSISAGSKKLAA
jgi:ClpP class serine protease